MGKALTDAKKQIATQLYASGGMTVSDIARQIGVSRDTLSYWLNKQPWYRVKHDVKRKDPKPREIKIGDPIKANKDVPENPYLPANTIKGGTGYGIYSELPENIDSFFPDYSIYPECDYAIGFITRGCPNKCRWCNVPKKEGDVHPYRHYSEVVREDTDKLVLMDNNILSCPWGLQNLIELSQTDYRIDLNQGMDARLVTDEVAEILSKIKWIKNIRFSCDQKNQIKAVTNAVERLKTHGVKPSKVFVYCLITNDINDDLERIYALRDLGPVTVYGMPERNPSLGIYPEKWQDRMAKEWIYGGKWRKVDWETWWAEHKNKK